MKRIALNWKGQPVYSMNFAFVQNVLIFYGANIHREHGLNLWVSECCLTARKQLFIHIIVITSCIAIRLSWCPLCSRPTLGSVASLLVAIPYQEYHGRTHRLWNIVSTERYLLHMQLLHKIESTQWDNWNSFFYRKVSVVDCLL